MFKSSNLKRTFAHLLFAIVLACGLSLPTSLAFANEGAGRALTVSDLSSGGESEKTDVDDIVAGMTLDEKISQMIVPAIRTWNGAAVTSLSNAPEVAAALQKHQYCGVILFGSNVTGTEQVARLISELQVNNAKIEATTKIPYLMPVDEEGGVVTRLSSGTRMTGSMAIGATGDRASTYAEDTGEIIGEELAAVGFNADFAPSIDVNCNPANPTIGTRSFSDDPAVVIDLGKAFGRGLAKNNVIATYKHFPGHGDTSVDSHSGLPSIEKTRAELDAIELAPFRSIVASADMIMTAHIVLPKVDQEETFADGTKGFYPATMSSAIIDGILRGEMGYNGVVVTDALEMDALYTVRFVEGDNGASDGKPGTAKNASTEYKINLAEKIINAGTDILLLPADMTEAGIVQFYDDYINGIKAKVENGAIPIDRINQSVTRILNMKKANGIFDTDTSGISETAIEEAKYIVGSGVHHGAEEVIAQQAVTMLKNENRTLPFAGAECNIVIVGRTKDDNVAIMHAIRDMQESGSVDPDARIVNLSAGTASGPEGALTNITIGYYCDLADAVNHKVSDELKAAIAKADEVVCLSTNWGLASLQPTHAQYKGVKAVFDGAREAKASAVLLSCNLPYDAARYQDLADAVVLCYMSTGTNVDPTTRNASLGGGSDAYNANVVAALNAIFANDELSNYAALGPQGHLPVNIPVGIVADDGSFSYSETSILYKRGFGLTYPDTPGKESGSLRVTAAKSLFTVSNSKNTTIAAKDAFKVVENTGKGKLTYEKTKGSAKIKVSKSGKVTVAKGLKKGTTYTITVRVSSAETSKYLPATATVKLKVKAKAPNTLKVKAAKSVLGAASGKSTAIAAKNAFKVVKNTGKGKLTYKKTKGSAKIKVSKSGKVTVAKGLKKGRTYTVKVQIASAETGKYLPAKANVTLKVKIK